MTVDTIPASIVRSPKSFFIFLAVTFLLFIFYFLNLLFNVVTPGNRWGLFYGTMATVLMVGVALLGVRRRAMKMAAKKNIGKVQHWVQFHLYGGVIALLFMLMHTGFSFPSGLLDGCLWVTSIWVTISGLLGVLIQKIIPKMLGSGLSIEVVYDRIPDLVNQIRERAEKIIPDCVDPIKDFYQQNMSAVFLSPKFRSIYFIDITDGIQRRMRAFDYLRRVLPVAEQEKLDQLQSLYKTKLEIDAHYTLQKVLRGWLYTHLPPSLILMVLIVLHLYTVWLY
jgi:hypothetical protein